jgi:hypothetical protein
MPWCAKDILDAKPHPGMRCCLRYGRAARIGLIDTTIGVFKRPASYLGNTRRCECAVLPSVYMNIKYSVFISQCLHRDRGIIIIHRVRISLDACLVGRCTTNHGSPANDDRQTLMDMRV